MEETKLKVIQNHYLATFSSPSGEIVLRDLKESFQDQPSFDEMNPDPHLTDFREGQRNVYLRIVHMMEEAREPIEKGEGE